MQKEHIISFNGTWYHIFFNYSRGLCVSKKINAKFTPPECILPNAFEDFCAAATNDALHVICQDEYGTILHFTFDGESWKSNHILNSRGKTPEFKNLTLKLVGNFINLFYVVHSKDDYVLVHQLLGEATSEPKAADYVADTDFFVCSHDNGDLSLLYKNSNKIYGIKQFRWSKKDFEVFCPLSCTCNLEHAVLSLDADENFQIAAYAVFDKLVNILFLNVNKISNKCAVSAIHLVSGKSEGLVISNFNDKLSVSWCENGLVMTADMYEGKWNTPKKYIRGTAQNILYSIQADTESFFTYGYRQDEKITLYLMNNILEHLPAKRNKQHAATREQVIPKIQNYHRSHIQAQEYVRHSVYAADITATRKLLKSQNDIIVEMLKKITALERAVLEKTEPQKETEENSASS